MGPLNTTTGPPSVAWATVVGTTWHSAQAKALARAPSWRCAWWAPTWGLETAPDTSLGGAALRTGSAVTREASPWQMVQALRASHWTVPSTCLPPGLMVLSAFTVSGWHWKQLLTAPWLGGGLPWQSPQVAFGPFQVGVRSAPPAVVSV